MENPYCFGNYSDCACNKCPVVNVCIERLAEKNAEYERVKYIEVEETGKQIDS